MSDRSAIEWTDASWNPIRARNKTTGKVGWHCEHATTGCEFCYAEGFNKRLGTGLPFKPGHRGDIELFLDEDVLRQPLHWKKPRNVFVCSMTDAFAAFVPDAWLFEIFAVMGACEDRGLGHQFQVLTKRADRMQQWISAEGRRAWNNCRLSKEAWPARNVWLGVSTERQQEADERIPELLKTPAAVRFISAEPLLGPIDLRYIAREGINGAFIDDALDGFISNGHGGYHGSHLDWVIVGGESGPDARSMHPAWARGLRDQCQAANVPFFFKQWGAWAPAEPEKCRGNLRSGWQPLAAHPHVARAEELYPEAGAEFVAYFGKKAAGRLLDGKLHDEFPARENCNGV